MRFLCLLIVFFLSVAGVGCDSAPEPPEETCTSTATTNVPAGEWEKLGPSGKNITTIASIAVHPCDPQVIYAGSSFDFSAGIEGRLFKTADGGRNWDTLRVGGSYPEIVISPADPDVVYVAHSGSAGRTGAGVLKSTDGGKTWQAMNDGLDIQDRPTTGANALAVHPYDPEMLYASTASSQLGGWFYRSTDGGETWTAVEKTDVSRLLGNGVRSIAFDPGDLATMYVGTAASGHMLKSTDGGKTWQRTGWDPTEIVEHEERYGSARAIHVSPENSNVMYAGTPVSESFHPAGVFVSQDAGRTWKPLTAGLPQHAGGQAFFRGQQGELYLAAWKAGRLVEPDDTAKELGGLFRLDPRAEAWSRIATFSKTMHEALGDLAYSPQQSAFCVGANGVFRLNLAE